MVARADILAGRAVIFIDIQDTVEKQLRGIRSKLRMFTAGISEVGGDLFRGGLAGSFASYFPVKEFVNFQDQLLFLQTKLQATDAQMKPLEKTIRDLGMSTSFSSKEVGMAATMFAQAGFSMAEVTNALQASLDLARGGQVDLTTATTILANAIRTFGADASQASDYASKFITAARLGTLDIVDLGQSLTYASGTFATLGVDIEYVLGLITTLSKSGLKASLAGTSLNTAFLNLSGSAEELREKLGVSLTMADFENPLLGLTKIQMALDKMSRFDQLKVVQELVNIRGGRAIFGTFLQGLDSLQETTDQIRNSSDEARVAATKLDSRLGGVGRRALSAFQELNLAIGSTAEGPLTTIGERAAKVFNDMSRLAQANPEVTQTLLLMAPAALAAGVGLLALTTILGKLAMFITPIMMLNAALFKTAGAIVGVNLKQLSNVKDFAKIQALSLKGVTGPSIGFGAGMLSSLTKIEAAAIRISQIEVFDKFLLSNQPFATLLNVLPKMEGLFNSIASRSETGRMSFAGAALTKPIMSVASGLEKAFASRGMQASFSNLIIMAFQKSGNAVTGVMERVVASVRGAGTARGFSGRNPIISSMQILANQGLKTLGPLWRGIRAGMRAAFSVNWLAKFISATKTVGTVFKGIFTVLRGIRTVLFSLSGWLLIVEGLILFGDKILGIKDLLAGLSNAFSQLFGDIGKTLANLGPSFSLLGRGISDVFGGNAERGVIRIKEAFGDMGNIISTGLSAAWAGFVANTKPGVDFIKEGFRVALATVNLLVASISEVFGGVADGFKIIVTGDGGFIDTIKSIFSQENRAAAYSMIGGFIAGLFTQILKVTEVIEKTLLEIKGAFLSIAGYMKQTFGIITEAYVNAPEFVNGISDVDAAMMSLDAAAARIEGLADIAAGRAATDSAKGMVSGALNERIAAIDKALSDFLDSIRAKTAEADSLPGKQGAADQAAATARNRGILASIMDGDIMNQGAGPAIKSLLGAAISQPLKDLPKSAFSAEQRLTESMLGTVKGQKLLEMIGREVDTNNPLQWIKDSGILMAPDDFSSSLKGLQPSEAFAKEQQRRVASSIIEPLIRQSGFKDTSATPSNNRLKAGIKNLFGMDLKEEAKGLWGGFKSAFGVPDLKSATSAQAEQLQAVTASIGKAVVGDFASTRGNLAQMVPKMEKLQEKANKHLEDIDEGIAGLNNDKTPFVFA